MCVSKEDRFKQNKKKNNNNNNNNNNDLDIMSKEAVLKYNKIFEIKNRDGYFSLLSVRLETGRKHQIRCQLSHINHPIVGDKLYSSPDRFHCNEIALHSYSLSFNHPIRKDKVILKNILCFLLYLSFY